MKEPEWVRTRHISSLARRRNHITQKVSIGADQTVTVPSLPKVRGAHVAMDSPLRSCHVTYTPCEMYMADGERDCNVRDSDKRCALGSFGCCHVQCTGDGTVNNGFTGARQQLSQRWIRRHKQQPIGSNCVQVASLLRGYAPVIDASPQLET